MSARTSLAAWQAIFTQAWQRSRLAALTIVALWVVAAGVTLAVGLEVAFTVRSHYRQSTDPRRYTQLANAYAPFYTESLHPHYLFFFPLSPAERRAMGNAVCSLDANGFREPGPKHAGTRKTAFLIGGSVAFGLFASSNHTTITSYLNDLQDEYFFVNAGVPGFNSTQELIRLTVELADYSPALVIAFNGWNDIAMAREPVLRDRRLPPGTPDGFPRAEELVAAAQRPWRHLLANPLFPELSIRLWPPHADPEGDIQPLASDRVAAAATLYVRNQQRMAAVTRSVGGRFMSVFQPLATLHRNVSGPLAGPDPAVAEFHRLVVTGQQDYEAHDMGAVFDRYWPAVATADDDISDGTVFVDTNHMYDPGNERVARHLWSLVQGQASPPN